MRIIKVLEKEAVKKFRQEILSWGPVRGGGAGGLRRWKNGRFKEEDVWGLKERGDQRGLQLEAPTTPDRRSAGCLAPPRAGSGEELSGSQWEQTVRAAMGVLTPRASSSGLGAGV